MARLLSVLKLDLTPEVVAKQIVMDGFTMQAKYPEMIVPSNLSIPIAKDCRRRVAKHLSAHMDHEFHSLFDKAIHEIEKVTDA
jgi:hypothetical protein